MIATTAAKLTALFARSSTRTLVESLRTLDATPRTPDHSWARAKPIAELDRRYPAASTAVEAAFEAAELRTEAGEDVEVDYVAVLIAAIPENER